MPDFLDQIDPENPAVDFKDALIALFDGMLQLSPLTADQRDQLARLRARTQIDLTAF